MEENLSVDEQMVPYKGRSCTSPVQSKEALKQVGYKMWVMCAVSGYAYDFAC